MMKEIIEQINKESLGISIEPEVILEEDYEVEDLDSLEEISLDEIIFKDCGREYLLGNISILKDLEPKRFLCLIEFQNEFSIITKDKKSEFINRATNCEDALLREHWANSYPSICETYLYPQVEVKEIPKEIRKEVFQNNNYELFENTQELLTEEVLSIEQLRRAFQQNIIDLIIEGHIAGVEKRTLRTLNRDTIENRIRHVVGDTPYLYIDEEFEIDESLDQFVQNDIYCQYLDEKNEKIPYSDEFEFEGYTIISPKKFMDFADESRAMHNCVGQPQQSHIQDCISGLLEVYFLREGNRHVATIGVEDNEVTTCLGRFNNFCEVKDKQGKIWFTAEEAKIVDLWAKMRGFKVNY